MNILPNHGASSRYFPNHDGAGGAQARMSGPPRPAKTLRTRGGTTFEFQDLAFVRALFSNGWKWGAFE